MRTIADLVAVVDTWNVLKKDVKVFNRVDMNRFSERMNAQTRILISYMEKNDPEFWTGLFELAQNACTQTTKGAKLFVDGIDRTNN